MWISVKDRLPEDDTLCLVAFEWDPGRHTFNLIWHLPNAEYYKWCDNEDGRGNSYCDDNLTHWMPIPEVVGEEDNPFAGAAKRMELIDQLFEGTKDMAADDIDWEDIGKAAGRVVPLSIVMPNITDMKAFIKQCKAFGVTVRRSKDA